MSLDYSVTSDFLKYTYPDGVLPVMGYKENPITATINKVNDWGGKGDRRCMVYSNPQTVSADFATAQARAVLTSSASKEFLVTPVKKFGIVQIDGEMAAASRTDRVSFCRAFGREIDGINESFMKGLERQLSGDGTGKLAITGTSCVSTVSLTLAHRSMAHMFEKGMELVFAANTTSALRDSGKGTIIIGINRKTGVLTSAATTASWADVASLGDGDSIFIKGDYTAAGSTTLCISGFAAWNPFTDPTSAAFFGIDRTSDRERLAGVAYDGSSDTIADALVFGANEGGMNGINGIKTAYLSAWQYGRLIAMLGPKAQYDVLNARDANGPIATIGFRSVVLESGNGPIKVIGAPLVAYDTCFMVDPEQPMLMSMGGDCPHVLAEDGNMIKWIPGYDTYQVNIGAYCQLGMKRTDKNINIKLATT
jgi:hypothetical protein